MTRRYSGSSTGASASSPHRASSGSVPAWARPRLATSRTTARGGLSASAPVLLPAGLLQETLARHRAVGEIAVQPRLAVPAEHLQREHGLPRSGRQRAQQGERRRDMVAVAVLLAQVDHVLGGEPREPGLEGHRLAGPSIQDLPGPVDLRGRGRDLRRGRAEGEIPGKREQGRRQEHRPGQTRPTLTPTGGGTILARHDAAHLLVVHATIVHVCRP
jgi:hypothetical protein